MQTGRLDVTIAVRSAILLKVRRTYMINMGKKSGVQQSDDRN